MRIRETGAQAKSTMSDALFVLTLVTALGAGLVAGTFFALRGE
jgi:hypothetical protein